MKHSACHLNDSVWVFAIKKQEHKVLGLTLLPAITKRFPTDSEVFLAENHGLVPIPSTETITC